MIKKSLGIILALLTTLPLMANAAAKEIPVQILCLGPDDQGVAKHSFGIISRGNEAVVYHVVSDITTGADAQLVGTPFIAKIKKTNTVLNLLHQSQIQKFALSVQLNQGTRNMTATYQGILGGDGYSAVDLHCQQNQILRFEGQISVD